MRSVFLSLALVALVTVSGCSTSQRVTLAKVSQARSVSAVAYLPQEGNSPEMTGHLIAALQSEGLAIKAPLAAGTRSSADVDAIVSYGDVWRWDLAMYLKSLSIQMYDAKTGDLLVVGDWSDSALHGFRDAREAVRGLVREMMAKVRSGTGQP